MKAMLFGPWKERKPDIGEWRVDLPDDDPGGLEILLQVVHGNPANFDLTRIRLFHLPAIIAIVDKYCMEELFRPWIQLFLRQHSERGWHEKHSTNFDLDFLRDLEAAWELGLASVVETFLAALMWDGWADDINTLASYGGFFQDHPHFLEFPTDPLRQLMERRLCYNAKIAAINGYLNGEMVELPSSAHRVDRSIDAWDNRVDEAFLAVQPRQGHAGCSLNGRCDAFREWLIQSKGWYQFLTAKDRAEIDERQKDWGCTMGDTLYWIGRFTYTP
ncbi:hypothetical protein VTJ49DRAFT_1280 [Mycothermus thermophilus]|uniref:Uncharacterized protein n=1 Tax=Humicola insolens TaxID=85995 RepID=A0ABR3VCS6_HUMIN